MHRATIAAALCTSVLVPSAGVSLAGVTATPAQTIVFGQSSSPEPGIYSIRSDGSALRRLTSGPDGGPVLSPDRTSIAFTRTRVIGEDFRGDDVTTLDLYVMRTDGSALRRLARVAHLPDWSPNGRRLAFVRYFGRAATIWTANADGTGARRIARAWDGGRPAWSPDGRKIAFDRWTGDFTEVFVVNADGTGERRLVRGARQSGVSPAWSPDGSRIAFFSDYCCAEVADYLYVTDGEGRDPRRVVRFTGEAYGTPPAWAPGGQRIAFAQYEDYVNSPNNEYIHVVRPTPAAPTRRLTGPDAWNPTWSSDGRRIAYVQGHRTIKLMDANGNGVRRVVRLTGTVGGFDW